MFPTEYVKTQLQLDKKGTTAKFTGPWHVVTSTMNERGILGLYRGLSVLLIGSVPKTAVRFSTYEMISKPMKGPDGKLSTWKSFLCGAGAGAAEAVVAVTPMETIKTKFIDDMNRPLAEQKYKGFVNGISTIVRTEGVAGIYKGLGPTVLKQASNQAVRFFVYNSLVKWRTKGDSSVSVNAATSLLFGGTAGFASVMANNPVDVIKTQMQGLQSSQYRNSFHCFFSILKNQGPKFFYKGVTPRLARVCGDSAITFTVYNKLLEFIVQLEESWKNK